MAQLGNLIVNGVTRLLSKLYVNGSVTAPEFIGKLTGKADTAGTADKLSVNAGSATQPVYFKDGKPVAGTYGLNKTVPSDAKFTDTWRGVQNNLTSTATDQSLSAAQGKVLKDLIDSKAASDHTHNYAGSSSAGGAATSANKLNTNAGSATQPVYFNNGVPVVTTYALNKTVPADAKFTDTNTWRGVQNNLTSDATDQSLSAAQGKALKALVDGKAASNHTHDLSALINNLSTGDSTPVDADYYVSQYVGGGTTTTSYHRRPMSALWNYIKGKADGVYLKLSGGKLTGALTFANNTWNLVGDDAYIGDFNKGGTLGIKGATGETAIALVSKSDNANYATLSYSGGNIVSSKKIETNITGHADGDLALTGGTMTGRITKNGGGSWISDRDNVAVFGTGTDATAGNRYSVVVGQKTSSGAWTVGNLSGNESLIFNYTTDANHDANTNSNRAVYLPAQAGTIITSATIGAQTVDTAKKVADSNNSTATTFAYSKSGMNYNDYTWLAAWNGYELRAVNKTQFAQAHSHPYLPTAGGTMTGNITFSSIGDTATSSKITWSGSTDGADIYYQTTAADQGNLVLNLRDDANCYLRIAKNGSFKSYFSPDDGNFHGNVNGTASAANSVNSFTFKAQTSDPGANSSLTTGQILLVYE